MRPLYLAKQTAYGTVTKNILQIKQYGIDIQNILQSKQYGTDTKNNLQSQQYGTGNLQSQQYGSPYTHYKKNQVQKPVVYDDRVSENNFLSV